jgi:copper(I)-binding protein
MIIESAGGGDRLVGARVDPPISRAVELHITENVGGSMVMRPVEGWDVPPPGGMLELKPGGNHVMMLGLARQLKAGDTLAIVLQFVRAGEVRIEVPVRDAAAGAGMTMPK